MSCGPTEGNPNDHAHGWLQPGVGQSITSDNGKYQLELQSDGNLVLSGGNGAIWETKTAGQQAARVDMQADGNFVMYTESNDVVWRTDTADKPGARLVLQDDRNIVIYAADRTTVLWSPNTYLSEAEQAAEAQRDADAKAKADAGPDPTRARS